MPRLALVIFLLSTSSAFANLYQVEYQIYTEQVVNAQVAFGGPNGLVAYIGWGGPGTNGIGSIRYQGTVLSATETYTAPGTYQCEYVSSPDTWRLVVTVTGGNAPYVCNVVFRGRNNDAYTHSISTAGLTTEIYSSVQPNADYESSGQKTIQLPTTVGGFTFIVYVDGKNMGEHTVLMDDYPSGSTVYFDMDFGLLSTLPPDDPLPNPAGEPVVPDPPESNTPPTDPGGTTGSGPTGGTGTYVPPSTTGNSVTDAINASGNVDLSDLTGWTEVTLYISSIGTEARGILSDLDNSVTIFYNVFKQFASTIRYLWLPASQDQVYSIPFTFFSNTYEIDFNPYKPLLDFIRLIFLIVIYWFIIFQFFLMLKWVIK